MPIITDPEETRRIIRTLQRRRVAMPCFCTENLCTTEAILRAATATGKAFGIAAPPVCIGMTSGYPGRSNAANYFACGDRTLGMRAILQDIALLASGDGPYGRCRILPALDHGQPDADRRMLERPGGRFAIVMFDGSALPFEQNMARTADYVAAHSREVVIEGAVDELKESSADGDAFEPTSVAQAERFLRETGCDLIVPNVGTEHRAAEAGRARYLRRRACEISRAVGPCMVMHGTSCLGDSNLARLPADGFVKVNIWTIIERKGAEQTVGHVLTHMRHMLSAESVCKAARRTPFGPLLGDQADVVGILGDGVGARLDTFPLANLRRRWVDAATRVLTRYFRMFGYERLRAS